MQTSSRSFLHLAALLGAVPSAFATTSPAGEFAIADTRDGNLRGVSINGIQTFKGIPYGASTAGKTRWMPPAKPTKLEHRLGCLGYLHLADLDAPAQFSRAGTVGIRGARVGPR